MESATARFAIAFNGEVCNAAQLAADLRETGWVPRGHSDTEVMLAAFEAWGIERALDRFAGMFGFALHDRQTRTLHLVRDRLGIKPLHWTRIETASGPSFAFASELRALLQVPGFRRDVDAAAIASMLVRGCVTGEACVWRGVRKLAPGYRLEINLASGAVRESCWWNAIEVAQAGCHRPFNGSDAGAIDCATAILDTVMREHLVADVPIGCLLSGGIDSTTVASAIREADPGATLTAFTAGFDTAAFDERAIARRTASALGMPMRELEVTEAAMLAAVARMAEVHDEPFADSSQLPTWLLCGEMRRHVTVALSGDGGDEVFGGYHRHVHAAGSWQKGRHVPDALRRLISAGALAVSTEAWDAALSVVRPLFPKRLQLRSPGESIRKWARCFGAGSEARAYAALTDLTGVMPDASASWWREADARRLPDFLRRMQFMDQTGYMVDDVLVKVDRASMAHGLEVRLPLLDHRLVEFAWSLPAHMKVRDGRGKWLLREMLRTRVPPEVLAAPKTGFGVPLGRWLRGPLRPWASDLLAPARVRCDALLDAARIERSWSRLLAGSDAPQHALWAVLMYLAWADRWQVSP
jgi:asparagine synthase (glutamine-hydrolysing)